MSEHSPSEEIVLQVTSKIVGGQLVRLVLEGKGDGRVLSLVLLEKK